MRKISKHNQRLGKFGVDIDIIMNDATTKHILAQQIKKEIVTEKESCSNKENREWKTLLTIKTKVIQNKLIITKSDKGNTLVTSK